MYLEISTLKSVIWMPNGFSIEKIHEIEVKIPISNTNKNVGN